MRPPNPFALQPILKPFVVWFLHFMASWAAGEIWPHEWIANAVAWAATAIALLALGVHYVRLKAEHADGALSGWSYRTALGAIGLAAAAVTFSALPSFVFLP